MPGSNVKIRTLYMMQVLFERSDEEHFLNASQLCDILSGEYGISCDRRTVYSEIEILMAYGMDVRLQRGPQGGYYVASRPFAMAELKILVDAVQSARFIPEKKAWELIRKLEGLCSKYQASELRGQVTIINRPRTENDEIFSTVEQLHDAIYFKKKVQFRYTAWDIHKKLVAKHGGIFYVVSPLGLVYDDEKYYLVGWDEKAEQVKHFRVDKVEGLAILEEQKKPMEFDVPSFARKTFGMFGGKDVWVGMRGREALVGTFIDQFGKDVFLRPDGEGYFRCTALVTVSPTFFGWFLGLGDGAEILSPPQVRSAFEAYLRGILSIYEKDKGDNVKGEES